MRRDNQPYAFRRHLHRCQFFGQGGRDVRADKCSCPFHADGIHEAGRIRQSLKTRSRQVADRKLAELIRKLDAQVEAKAGNDSAVTPTLAEAAKRFLRKHGEIGADGKYRGDSEHATWRKYRTKLNLLETFFTERGIAALDRVTLAALEDYHHSRNISAVTWKVELQALRTFFAYCISHKWIANNPAREIKPPRNIKPNDVVPYTLHEESQILAACDQIGGAAYQRAGATYERLRARAMVKLFRHTALRISDVCTLRKDSVSWDPGASTWRIWLRTQKSGEAVYLPVPEDLKLALHALPVPRNAPKDCPYYFWNGQTSRRAVVGIAERAMAAVFKKSGVKNAHPHRFRHTLATRLLEQGGTFEQVADILGNSPAVVRKHYGKWSKGRQNNIDRLMMAHFQAGATTVPVTPQSHENLGAVN